MPPNKSTRSNTFGSPLGFEAAARGVRASSIYGQESNSTARRLAIMNIAIRGIEADFGPEYADTFRRDLHPDLRADYVLANPPINDADSALRCTNLFNAKPNRRS